MIKPILATIIYAAIVSIQSALAHDGLHRHNAPIELRQWKIGAGDTQFEGSFVCANEKIISIQLKDNRIISINRETLSAEDKNWIQTKQRQIESINSTAHIHNKQSEPAIAKHFQHFVDAKAIKTRWDDNYFFVESNGMPDHEMMVGITAWQQQVPIPHNYTGNNAWRIPLKSTPAKQPMSAKNNFFRGAIALAVNGVPIFNPIKNDGKTDTKLAGELDEFGGHCGRADDYHYHLPPVHLEEAVGAGNPIAFALDGYPILGFQSDDEAQTSKLDWLNGHKDDQGNYHYHSTKIYPYLNGGFYGEVTRRGGQVDPQPRAQGIRPAERPLRGARITGFSRSENGKDVTLEFQLRSETRSVSYTTDDFKKYVFEYDDGTQGKKTQTYSQRPERARGERGQPDRRGGRGDQNRRPPQQGNRQSNQKGQDRSGRYEKPPVANFVPDHDSDILLGQSVLIAN